MGPNRSQKTWTLDLGTYVALGQLAFLSSGFPCRRLTVPSVQAVDTDM